VSGLPADAATAPTPEALAARVRFALEADRLKGVLRRTRLLDGSRQENSAEHSWHAGLLAMLFADAAPAGADPARVVRMLLVHDLVEVEAGDTFCYDAEANLGREEREQAGARRLFGLLPAGEGAALRALWDEFEAGTTPDARFAVALDRFQPLLLNLHGGGGSWLEHGVSRGQVLRRMEPIRTGAPALWPLVEAALEQATAAGWVRADGA
jgi:putative hydrolase of HD superfamily